MNTKLTRRTGQEKVAHSMDRGMVCIVLGVDSSLTRSCAYPAFAGVQGNSNGIVCVVFLVHNSNAYTSARKSSSSR